MSGDPVRLIEEIGVLPVVRLDDLSRALDLADALASGGIPVLEFTLTNPDAVDVIRMVGRERPDLTVGAGTVLDAASARLAILAGARFLVTPVLRPEVIVLGRRYGVPTLCGAFTPTEILAAWEQGSPCIKVFPASTAGPSYFRAVREPLPQVRLMPSGGVTLENTPDFIRAGAAAVSAGGQLVSPDDVRDLNWAAIRARACAFVSAVRDARDHRR
ncbi:MAG TPA: bifunctional 4-hydroxy-2-oxoglutarate aldolase/2-dehydro-3-deoxy-phosphogluconate aldolase [Chloroflexota bacterium]|nr:bifunctional 4-hydroxy-2-oxoglutarate aldolase/2-dehydro-3-deoxy-phosphogluconate aldolase [Chloroflexota bacterium]